MAAQALPLAQLLAGEMPRDIEELFAACKVALFPRRTRELTARCTCPDWENPCKHIAAVYYLLAERFDDDPFLIFAWRGRSQDELLERLRALRRVCARAPRRKRRGRLSTTACRSRPPSTASGTPARNSPSCA